MRLSSRGSLRFPAGSGTTGSPFPVPTRRVRELGDTERKTRAIVHSSTAVDDAQEAGARHHACASSADAEPVSAFDAPRTTTVVRSSAAIVSAPNPHISSMQGLLGTSGRPAGEAAARRGRLTPPRTEETGACPEDTAAWSALTGHASAAGRSSSSRAERGSRARVTRRAAVAAAGCLLVASCVPTDSADRHEAEPREMPRCPRGRSPHQSGGAA
jgi:hypothetical protein